MAMAESREWQQHQDDAPAVEERLRIAEEQRVQAEGRCFAAERRRLDAERRLAEAELLLEQARAAGERSGQLVGELIGLAGQLRRSLEHTPLRSVKAPAPDDAAAAERAQMADALAAAVERLRARVAEVKAGESDEPAPAPEPLAPVAPEVPAAVALAAVRALPARAPHKHSMSAIARWRNRRKQRQAA